MSGSELFQTKVGAFTGHVVNLRGPEKIRLQLKTPRENMDENRVKKIA